jgi:hypothetical protein
MKAESFQYVFKQWESRYFEYDRKTDFFSRGKIVYDAINQRERVIDEVVLGSDKEFYDVLYLHALQTEFRYSFKTRNCTAQKITRDWRDFRIPDNATK